MALRTLIGLIACGLYSWRIYDPKQSYAGFYDAANWLTGWLLDDGGVIGTLRRIVNLVLLDQVEGFLIGIAIVTLLSLPIWALRKSAGWGMDLARSRRRWRSSGRSAAMVEALPVEADTLALLSGIVDFNEFRSDLKAALRASGHPGQARDAIEPLAMFRMLVLQDLHGLSLEQTARLVQDRLTWMRFCGVNRDGPFPTSAALARFQAELKAAEMFEPLMARVGHKLTDAGYRLLNGHISDASLIAAGPRETIGPKGA
jgi:hypothetical protein